MRPGSRALSVYVALYLGFIYLPILMIPLFSFNASVTPSLPLSGFTLDWYAGLVGNDALQSSLLNSLLVGVATAVLATAFGIAGARAVTRYRFPAQKGIVGLIMAPLVLPEVIVGISMLIVLLRLEIPLSLATIILGHVLIAIPYSMMVLIGGFQGFDRSLEEASADLGETAFGTFRRVTLPILAPAVMSSMLVAFTISLDEFIIAFFLGGTETTLPIYLWSQLRFPQRVPVVLALGTLMLAASFALLVAAETLRRRAARRGLAPGGTVV